jgi:hypothetical protein
MKNAHDKRRQAASRGRENKQELTQEQRALVHRAVKKVVKEYGETLRMLGQE